MLIINISFFADLNSMKVEIIIKIYKLKLIKITVDLLLNRFKVNNGKYRRLKFILKQEEKYLISQIKQNVLNKLYYDSVFADIIINLLNPAITANTVGIINQIFEFMKYYLFIKNNDMNICLNCRTDFKKCINKIKLEITVLFTIFDMIYAIILSFYKRGKYVKENRQ